MNYSYGRQDITEADIQAVCNVLNSDFLTQGPAVDLFEEALCRYTGAKYCVAVSNGTAALHIAVLALGIQGGDEVITSVNTFLASGNSILYAGGVPRFVDIASETGNMDENLLEKEISEKTKMMIPVHFAGQSCDMKRIRGIADRHHLKIIEDAAHAIGSDYLDTKVGSCAYSDITVFSFHPVKNITTGEGGALMTNDSETYEILRMLRSHGVTKAPRKLTRNDGPWYYEMQMLGFNYRMTDLQAALGISQLKRLEEFKKKRREIMAYYRNAFQDTPGIKMLQEHDFSNACFHLCPLLIDFSALGLEKKDFVTKMANDGIRLQVHYIPLHFQPYYARLGFLRGVFPNAEQYYEKTVSLPLHPGLDSQDLESIVIAVYRNLNLKQKR